MPLEHLSKPDWRFFGVFGCLCVINLICAIDATILVVALPTFSNALGGTTNDTFWAGTSFLLSSTVFQPSWASFSHILGRKLVLLIALGLFTVGTIIASVAQNFVVLLVGRSIQGVGGGGLIALTYVIVTDMVTLKERGKWFSLISLQWSIGSVSGPLIGGAISQANWRWIFWLNLPFALLALVAIPCLSQKFKISFKNLKLYDWIGSFLFSTSLTSFLVPLTWGGTLYEWSSWRTLVPLTLGALGLLGFLLYSKYISAAPLIQKSIFSTPTARVGYFGTFVHGMLVWSMLYYLPLYYEVAKDFSPTMSGVALFPLSFTTAPAAIAVGFIIAKTGRYRPSAVIGWGLCTLGFGLLLILEVSSTTVQWVCFTAIAGTGTGILYSAQAFAVQAPASNFDLPFAAAMYSFFRSLGQTFGVAVGGVIFQNRLKTTFLNSSNPILVINAKNWTRDASALVQIISAFPITSLREEIILAYVDSLRVIWAFMCALSGVAFILALAFIEDITLVREELETNHNYLHHDLKKEVV